MQQEVIVADVLCIGGGIAGLMAAISAAESGAKVVAVDKSNTLRSGAGATGNDHFRCYIHEFHGDTFDEVVDEVANSQSGWSRNKKFVRTWMERAFDIVKLWDSWGIPMKHDGKWEFSGHTLPGGVFTTLKYAGQNQKPVLTKEALKRGVKIMNRVMVYDLITEGDIVVGAVGIDTREDKLILYKVRSVIAATGNCAMLYPGPTPGWMFNRADPPSSTGDGRMMAFRAGAKLVNMEMPRQWAGPKNFARCGKATWIGILKDSQNKSVGPFAIKPDRRYGDAISDAYPTLFQDYAKSGKGPVYMDCRGISDEDYDYMMYGLKNEGNMALVEHLAEEKINLKKQAVEFTTYEMSTRGGIYYNEKGETSLKGLYAAGDEYFGGISCAATFGWIAGENASRYIGGMKTAKANIEAFKIKKLGDFVNQIRSREKGVGWQEASIALQQIMYDYAGSVRTESLLKAGLKHLKRFKRKVHKSIMANNQHELMHCLEVLNLIDIGEIVFQTILERKETRGRYFRQDYPFLNPLFNGKVLFCRKSGDKLQLGWSAADR
jgi:succinate dehydrogenase/fumarate reductase flavoprotein subunit